MSSTVYQSLRYKASIPASSVLWESNVRFYRPFVNVIHTEGKQYHMMTNFCEIRWYLTVNLLVITENTHWIPNVAGHKSDPVHFWMGSQVLLLIIHLIYISWWIGTVESTWEQKGLFSRKMSAISPNSSGKSCTGSLYLILLFKKKKKRDYQIHIRAVCAWSCHERENRRKNESINSLN